MRKSLFLLIAVLLVSRPLFPQQVMAAELKEKTRQAFAHYTQIAESRMQSQVVASTVENKPFLWVNALDAAHRQPVLDRLRNGEVVTERLQEKENGNEIKIPDGMVHHWIGTVFVKGGNLKSTLALLQDYDHHKDLYKPEVIDSRLISHTGGDFKAYLRFYKKKIIGVTLNTEHAAQYVTLTPTRAFSNSHTTRVAEVENAGTKSEREKPVGNDSGFLWALNSYWRMEEKDGGVYVQCEAVSLTRDIPAGLGWIVKPFITEVPKESLYTTLNSTRLGLMNATKK